MAQGDDKPGGPGRGCSDIVSRSFAGIFRTTPDGQVLEANPALLRALRMDSVAQMNEVG